MDLTFSQIHAKPDFGDVIPLRGLDNCVSTKGTETEPSRVPESDKRCFHRRHGRQDRHWNKKTMSALPRGGLLINSLAPRGPLPGWCDGGPPGGHLLRRWRHFAVQRIPAVLRPLCAVHDERGRVHGLEPVPTETSELNEPVLQRSAKFTVRSTAITQNRPRTFLPGRLNIGLPQM